MSARRVIAMAARAERRAAPAGRYGLGARVLSAREPKLLRAATRLATARTTLSRSPAPNFGAPPPYLSGPSPKYETPPAPPAPSATSPAPTPAPAITPESLGIGPASFEWLFGDPAKALAHPDVTAGPASSLPPLSPAQRTERRVARLAARGGSAYGRGARINEGAAAKAPDLPPATAEPA